MAHMFFDEDWDLDEPCLSCDKANVEDIWYEWYCDEKICPYREEKENSVHEDNVCIKNTMECEENDR